MRIEVNAMRSFHVGLVGLFLFVKHIKLDVKVISAAFVTSEALENVEKFEANKFVSYPVSIL